MEVYNAVGGRWVDACSNDMMGRERRRRERPKMGEASDQRNLVCEMVCECNFQQDLFTCRQHEHLQRDVARIWNDVGHQQSDDAEKVAHRC